MAERIEIKMTDGTSEVFNHRGRPGGSYTICLTFENGFAVVTDEYGKRVAFPESRIAKVTEIPGRY